MKNLNNKIIKFVKNWGLYIINLTMLNKVLDYTSDNLILHFAMGIWVLILYMNFLHKTCIITE